MGGIDDINKLFQIVDFDDNCYIDKEKLQCLCPHLSQIDINTIFKDCDKDHDDRISLKDLKQFNDYSRALFKQNRIDYQYNIEENMTQTQVNEIFNTLACQDQIYDFYESLRNGSSDSVDQFQSILEVFVCDVLKYRKEIKRLEDSYKREKETNEKYLRAIEEDQERDMRQLEEKVRQEERQKFDIERELAQQRTTKQINELQANLQRLRKIDQIHTDRINNEDSSTVLLREEIAKLSEETQTLNTALNDSLTTNAILESDVQSLKAKLAEKQTILLQEKQSSSSNHREKESLQTNVRHLVEVNKQLRDENDSLRAVIETNKANTNNNNTQHSSNFLSSPKRLISTAGSTIGSYWNHPKKENVNSLTPAYPTNLNQPRFNSFDLGSADEIGMLASPYQPTQNAGFTLSSNKNLSLATASTVSYLANENNNNDSGLSITTVRDATEIDSDTQSRTSQQIPIKTLKQQRTLPHKKTDDTDSDDVFVELSLDRAQSKRLSQQRRTLKRTNTNPQSANMSPSIARSPALKRIDGTTTTVNVQQDLSFDRMFKVVFCGDASVGKSTLIMRLCQGKFIQSVNSTLGVDFQNKQIEVDGKRVALQLWDTAGQERFRSIAKSYFRRCDGVILVYDATYERSFINVREWINTITDSAPKKVSVMIVGNKIDLRDQARTEGKRVIEHAEGVKLAKENKALFIETSAKDGTNANESLIELAREMRCNEDLERFRTAGIDLDKRPVKKSTCCGS